MSMSMYVYCLSLLLRLLKFFIRFNNELLTKRFTIADMGLVFLFDYSFVCFVDVIFCQVSMLISITMIARSIGQLTLIS